MEQQILDTVQKLEGMFASVMLTDLVAMLPLDRPIQPKEFQRSIDKLSRLGMIAVDETKLFPRIRINYAQLN